MLELHCEECIPLSDLVPSASAGVPDGARDAEINVLRPFPEDAARPSLPISTGSL